MERGAVLQEKTMRRRRCEATHPETGLRCELKAGHHLARKPDGTLHDGSHRVFRRRRSTICWQSAPGLSLRIQVYLDQMLALLTPGRPWFLHTKSAKEKKQFEARYRRQVSYARRVVARERSRLRRGITLPSEVGLEP